MDVFEALLKLILDEKSLANIKSKVNKELKVKVGTDSSKVKAEVNKLASELSRLSKVNTMQSWYDNNTKATKQMRAEVGKLIAEMGNLDKKLTVDESAKITARFKEIQYQARATGRIGKSAADKFKTAWEKFGGWGIATGAFMKLKTEVVDGIKFIGKLDDALTDVTYTSNISKTGLEELGNSSIKMAKDLNASAENVLEAVKIYSTAKASADDILRKAKPAIMLSNISGMSGSESSKTINTALNQFGLEDTEEQLLDITDTLQYVSSQLNYDFTEGIKQITEGIEASGSVAKNAGLNMQEYAAMVGVAVEQTGQSGSTIGNAYKTIFSRITKASEIEGTLGEDISNAEEALRGIGVQVRSANNDFRDMTDIMADIGSKWNELNDVQKAKVGYEVAGIRQLNVLNSLFGSWQSYSDIIADVDKRTGTTLENQEKYAESLQGHLGDIKATTQSIWNNIFDTGDFKSALSGFNDLLGLVEKITDKLGTWGTLAAGVGMWQGIKNAGVFKADNLKSWFGGNKNIAQPFANAEQVIWKYNQAIAHNSLTQQGWERILAQSDDGLKSYLTSIKGTTATTTAYTTSLNSNFMGLKNVASAISQYNLLATKGKTEQQGLVNVINASNSSLGGYLSGLNGASASLAGYGMSLLGATAKTIGLTAASMALNAVLSMGISVAIQAAIAGIAALGKWMDDLIVTDAELSEKIKDIDTKWKELSSTIQNSAKAFQDLKAQADDIIPRYAKLAQGVDKFGNNVSLTDEEFKEFVSLNNQLGQMFPELVTGYDSNGNAILALSGDVDTLTESLYACVEAQRLATAKTIAETMPEILEGDNGIVESVKLYEEQIKRKREALDEWNEYVKHHRDSLYKDGTKIEDRFIEEDVIALAEQLGVEREQIQHLIEYVEDDEYSGHFNADKVFDSNVMKNAVAGYEKAIDDIQKRIESKWKQLNPVISAWLSTDFLYQDLDVDGQNIISSLIGELDFKSLGLKTSEDIQDYISNNIISPIYDMDADAQKAFFEIFDIQEAVKKGELSIDDFKGKLDELLSKGNFSDEFKKLFKEAFGDIEKNVQGSTFLNKMTVSLSDLKKASDNLKHLGTAFKELSDDGYITIDTISSIKDAVGDSVDNWGEYENKLMNAKAGSSEFNQVMSELTYAILESQIGTDKLANADENYIATILRENGVVNANEVALSALIRAKTEMALSTNQTEEAFLSEINTLGLTKTVVGDLQSAYVAAQNAMTTATSEQVLNRLKLLKEEVQDVASVAEAYALISTSRERTSSPLALPSSKSNIPIQMQRLSSEEQAIVDYAKMKEKILDIANNMSSGVSYSGGGSSGGGGGGSSDKNEALDNYLEYAEDLYKVHQDELKYINDIEWAYHNLAKTMEEQAEIAEKIEEARRDYADNRIKDLEHENELLEQVGGTEEQRIANLQEMQRIREEEANRYREWMREQLLGMGYTDEDEISRLIENSDFIQEQQSGWWDAENKKLDLYEQRREDAINDIIEPYDRAISLLESRSQQLDSQLQLAEAKGLMASTRYYEKMQDVENRKLEHLQTQRDDLTKLFNEQVANGDIEVGSKVWYELQNQIDDITQSIDEATIAVADFDNQMRQVLWDRFDYLVENFSNLTSEADFLVDLLGEDLHDDNGRFNDNGMAVTGLHGVNYNVYMEKALSYANELAKIEEEIAKTPYDTNLIARKQELLELQRDSILAAESEKEAIVSLVEEGINLELNALQELINKYKENLNSAKDLYDYQRKIAEQTKSITDIEKQLAAYDGDTSEETKAKIQQLKVDLENAEQNLRDAEYDKYISDQQELLDDLYSQFEDTLNARLEDTDALIEDMIDTINTNSSSIAETLKSETAKVGTELSSNMESIWQKEDQALRTYLDEDNLIGGFKLEANGYFDQMLNAETGITTALGTIAGDINSIMEYASAIAKAEEDADFTKNQMIQNSKDWWGADDDTKEQLEKENNIYGESLGYTKGEDGSWYDNDGDKVYEVSISDKVTGLVSQMKKNSSKWSESNTAKENQDLNDANYGLAKQIEALAGKKVKYDDASGKWYIGNEELYKKYASGGLADYTGLAWLDGTPSKPELVLSPKDTENFIALKDYLAIAAEKGLYTNPVIPNFEAPLIRLPEMQPINKDVNVVNHFNIAIDHVEDYNDFVNQLRKDRQFEKMVQSMSVDLLAGKSSLAKNKYKW